MKRKYQDWNPPLWWWWSIPSVIFHLLHKGSSTQFCILSRLTIWYLLGLSWSLWAICIHMNLFCRCFMRKNDYFLSLAAKRLWRLGLKRLFFLTQALMKFVLKRLNRCKRFHLSYTWIYPTRESVLHVNLSYTWFFVQSSDIGSFDINRWLFIAHGPKEFFWTCTPGGA